MKLSQLSMIDPLIISGTVSSTATTTISMATEYREHEGDLAHHLYPSHKTDKNLNPGPLAALATRQLHIPACQPEANLIAMQ
jgi:hypothetical protein